MNLSYNSTFISVHLNKPMSMLFLNFKCEPRCTLYEHNYHRNRIEIFLQNDSILANCGSCKILINIERCPYIIIRICSHLPSERNCFSYVFNKNNNKRTLFFNTATAHKS